MTPKEEAKRLINEFSKVKNVTYSVVKDRIFKNLIVQNAIIHCKIMINNNIKNNEKVNYYMEIINELKKQENE